MTAPPHLDGGTAVVTGAASGIGRALARRLAARGMSVVAVDVEEPALAETVAVDPGPGGLDARVVDVAERGAVLALADDLLATHGPPRLLANNAGVFQGGRAWGREPADWEWVLGVNLHGLVNGVEAFLPAMLERAEPAWVVNTASMAGLVCAPYAAPYQVSKFAAYGYTESLAQDLAVEGAPVGVSVLCPSAVDTGIARSSRNRPGGSVGSQADDEAFVEQALADTIATGLDPQVVADLVVAGVEAGQFLIPTNDDHRDWITGHTEDVLALRVPRLVSYS